MKDMLQNFAFFTLSIFASWLVFGCTHYTFTEEEKGFVSYKEGDTLIFESSLEELDTIFILGIEEVKRGYLTFPPPREKSLNVSVDHSVVNPDSVIRKRSDDYFLILNKFKKDSIGIYFNLEMRDVLAYYDLYIGYEQLKKKKAYSLTLLNGKKLDDVIILNAHPMVKKVHGNDPGFVEKLYWSRSQGYVKIELGTGKTWTLKEKIPGGN
jgi:hypothetical protein